MPNNYTIDLDQWIKYDNAMQKKQLGQLLTLEEEFIVGFTDTLFKTTSNNIKLRDQHERYPIEELKEDIDTVISLLNDDNYKNILQDSQSKYPKDFIDLLIALSNNYYDEVANRLKDIILKTQLQENQLENILKGWGGSESDIALLLFNKPKLKEIVNNYSGENIYELGNNNRCMELATIIHGENFINFARTLYYPSTFPAVAGVSLYDMNNHPFEYNNDRANNKLVYLYISDAGLGGWTSKDELINKFKPINDTFSKVFLLGNGNNSLPDEVANKFIAEKVRGYNESASRLIIMINKHGAPGGSNLKNLIKNLPVVQSPKKPLYILTSCFGRNVQDKAIFNPEEKGSLITIADYRKSGHKEFILDIAKTLFTDIRDNPSTIMKHILKYCTQYRNPEDGESEVYFSGFLPGDDKVYFNRHITDVMSAYSERLELATLKPTTSNIISAALTRTRPISLGHEKIDPDIVKIIEQSLAVVRATVLKNQLINISIDQLVQYLGNMQQKHPALAKVVLMKIREVENLTATIKGLKEILAFSIDTLASRFDNNTHIINTSTDDLVDIYIFSRRYIKQNLGDDMLNKFIAIQNISLKAISERNLFKNNNLHSGMENIKILLNYWNSVPDRIQEFSIIIMKQFLDVMKSFTVINESILSSIIIKYIAQSYISLNNIDINQIPDSNLRTKILYHKTECQNSLLGRIRISDGDIFVENKAVSVMKLEEITNLRDFFGYINANVSLTENRNLDKLFIYYNKVKIIKTGSLIEKIALFNLINKSTENEFKFLAEFKNNFPNELNNIGLKYKSFKELKDLYLVTDKIKITNLPITQKAIIADFKKILITNITSLIFIVKNPDGKERIMLDKEMLISKNLVESIEIKKFYSALLQKVNGDTSKNVQMLVDKCMTYIMYRIRSTAKITNEPLFGFSVKELSILYDEMKNIEKGIYPNATLIPNILEDIKNLKPKLTEQAMVIIKDRNGNITIDNKFIGAMNDEEIRVVDNFYEALKREQGLADQTKITLLTKNIKQLLKNREVLKTTITPEKFNEMLTKFKPSIVSKFTQTVNELIRTVDPTSSNLMDRYMKGDSDERVTITFEKLSEARYNAYVHDPITNKVHTIVVELATHPEAYHYIEEHETYIHGKYNGYGRIYKL